MANRKTVTRRTAERLIRAAYEYEYLAARLRHEGYVSAGDGVREISRWLGKIGRDMLDKFGG